MRSATILVLCLRSLAHETIKNLVLAGIGRLIIMDDGDVTEEDLGSGFLFREEDEAVGKPVSYVHDIDLRLGAWDEGPADIFSAQQRLCRKYNPSTHSSLLPLYPH